MLQVCDSCEDSHRSAQARRPGLTVHTNAAGVSARAAGLRCCMPRLLEGVCSISGPPAGPHTRTESCMRKCTVAFPMQYLKACITLFGPDCYAKPKLKLGVVQS